MLNHIITWLNKFERIITALTAIILGLLALLVGCSPHPGSGTWVATGENEMGFSRLVVQFEGRAEVFASGQEKEMLRCFWAGESAQSIRLGCASVQDADTKLSYSLALTGTDRAQLLQSGNGVAEFRR